MDKKESQFKIVLRYLDNLAQHPDHEEGVPLGQIFLAFGVQSHLILLVFLCLPFLQPIPLVGISTVLAFLMALIGISYLLGIPPWLPKKASSKLISKTIIFKCSEVLLKVWNYLEKVIKPRGQIYFSHPSFKVVTAFIVMVNSFLLALPLPIPFTNTVPVLVILIHCLGLLEEDGILVYLSVLASVACFAFFASLSVLIKQSVPYLWDLFQGWYVML